MGVKGLQFYVERVCDDVCQNVNIKAMADSHRRTLPHGERPVIVVDGMGIIRKLYSGSLDWVCGGQWTEFVHQLQDFVKRFEAAGITLKFFFDGPVCKEKRHEWVSRRIEKAKKIEGIFNYLKRVGKQPKNEDDFIAPASIGTLIRFALKFCCNVEVITTVKEADFEIAAFAKDDYRVVAILAQDTDFLIFDTKPYISLNHLNLENLTTILYDRQRLVSRLKLNVSHLPLFSCMLGNDVIPVDLVKPFHRKICQMSRCRGRGIDDVAPLVSRMIIRNRWRGDFRDERELNAICQELFNVRENSQLLRDGLMFYFLFSTKSDGHSSFCEDIVTYRHVTCENFPAVYGLIKNMEFDGSEVLEDFTDASLPSVNLAYRPIRKRAYSILFQGKDKKLKIQEWCSVPRKELYNPELVNQISINITDHLPNWKDLWTINSPKIQEMRVRCFYACLGGTLQPSFMNRIKQKYNTFCCIINYLLNYGPDRRPLLSSWEVTAFIAQAICLQAYDVQLLNSLKVPHIDTHAVHLASLFMRGLTTVGLVLSICGYPFPIIESMPWNFFNGKLFHMMYLEAKQGKKAEELCFYRVELIQEFYDLQSVITYGTALAGR